MPRTPSRAASLALGGDAPVAQAVACTMLVAMTLAAAVVNAM